MNENPKVQHEPKQEQHMEQHSMLRTKNTNGNEQNKAIETGIIISIDQ